jgi:peroxiredoxin
MRARACVFSAVLGLLLLSGVVRSSGANEAVLPLVGKDAPHFETVDGDGQPVTMTRLLADKGPVLINFWGLRCGACLQEIPHLNQLQVKHRKSGLRILGVNVDGLPGPKVKAQMDGMRLKLEYPWVPDPDFKVIDLFQMNGAPLNVIVSPSGKVVYHHEGFEEGDEAALEAEILKAMAPPQTRAVRQ